jgi:hypothetical protein
MARNKTTRTEQLRRPLWKAACQLHDRLAVADDWRRAAVLPEFAWNCCHASYRQIEAAGRLGWQGAVRVMRREARDDLTSLIHALETARSAIDPDRDAPVVVSVAEIYRDLLSLDDEFPEVRCNLSEQQLSVFTEPIELEETYLGAFEIRLNWKSAELGYAVIARDPQPSERSSGVTHPHVQDERLCEGDGRLPIRLALRQGRLADFFLVVRQVLETYNSSSAYVALDQWFSQDCPECGGELYDDDSSCCETCGNSFCSACTRDCAACSAVGCGNCQQTCPECDEPVCHFCLTMCERCHESLCKRCLDDKSCSTCRTREEVRKQAEREAAVVAGAAVHAVCVEQTAVPA